MVWRYRIEIDELKDQYIKSYRDEYGRNPSIEEILAWDREYRESKMRGPRLKKNTVLGVSV